VRRDVLAHDDTNVVPDDRRPMLLLLSRGKTPTKQ
jgi:hypothetical protein